MKFLFLIFSLLILFACDSSEEALSQRTKLSTGVRESTTASAITEQKQSLAKLEDKIRNGDRQEVEQLLSGIVGLDFPENTVTIFINRYREASDLRHSRILQGLGPNHPDIIALDQTMETSFAKAKEDFLRVIRILQSK